MFMRNILYMKGYADTAKRNEGYPFRRYFYVFPEAILL